MSIEPILVRGRIVMAERIYESKRGDYTTYRYRGRTYVVKHERERALKRRERKE